MNASSLKPAKHSSPELPATASAGLLEAQRKRHAAQVRPGPIGTSRIVRPLLLGDEAAITGGLRPSVVGDGCKRLQVRNWNTAGDSFMWQVDARRPVCTTSPRLRRARALCLN